MKKILNNILYRFKEDSLAKRKELTDRHLEYKTLKEIKTCLVFWSAGGNEKDCLRKLSENLKDVKITKLCFVTEGMDMPASDETVVLRNEDLGFGGKVQNERLHALLSQKYDLLVDLNTTSTALFNYVLTNTQASCIVGMKKEGSMADITIDEISGPVDFIDKFTEVLLHINKY